jgi:uncharacterized coiled-coil DUF342 family protein
MAINPEMIELKNLILQTHEMVVQLSKDVNYMRGELSQINERLGSLENRVTTVEINEVESSLNARINDTAFQLSKEIREVFKWMVGMMIPVWIGVLVAIIAQLIKG